MHPINQALLDDGWREFPSPFRDERKQGYAKSFEGHSECRSNKRKRKQIQIYHNFSQTISGHRLSDTWTVECVGQLPDNEWLRMKVDSLTSIDDILRTVQFLLAVWDYSVSIAEFKEEEE